MRIEDRRAMGVKVSWKVNAVEISPEDFREFGETKVQKPLIAAASSKYRI